MIKKKKVLTIDLNNINETLKNISNLEKNLNSFKADVENNLRKRYLKSCLNEIKKMSINKLNMKDTFEPSYLSGVRDNISIKPIDSSGDTWELNYFDDIVAYVEFGTGRIGGIEPHPLASREGYEYDVDSPYKDEYGYWSWANRTYNAYFTDFLGYKGKRFVYESFRDFINERMYVKIYEKELKRMLEENFE